MVSLRFETSVSRVLALSLSLVIFSSSSSFSAVSFSIELFFPLSQSLCFSILSVRPPIFIFFAFLVRKISLSAIRFICFFIVFISLDLTLTWSLSFFFLASSSKFSASSLSHSSLRFFSSDPFLSTCSLFIFIFVFISWMILFLASICLTIWSSVGRSFFIVSVKSSKLSFSLSVLLEFCFLGFDLSDGL